MLAGQIGARGQIRADTGDALDVVPLLVGLHEQNGWSLPPVLPRQDFVTKEIRRLLQEGRDGRSLQCCPGHSGLMKPA